MNNVGIKNPNADLGQLGFKGVQNAYWNLSPKELTQMTLAINEGIITDTGALAINTGKFTGRSPEDRFIVRDAITENTVDWGKVNKAFDADKFDALYNKVVAYFEGKDVYVRDAFACADPTYRLSLRVVAEKPWSSIFAYNMFIRPTEQEVLSANPEWTVINAPGFLADPALDGTRQANFAILNFTRKCIIVGGTGYTGEIKKGIFSALNFILPVDRNVFPMHCSANVGKNGDTAVFFGLSGTGKTTLSADPERDLIGDDEHGWSDHGVFNFEGGCYAKTIDLSAETEPQIYAAIREGALLENIGFEGDSNKPNYSDKSITENTRVSYPLTFIDNALEPSVGGNPKNIFFLTCDAFGVLPPISKLTPGQAMYQFISGYTAKVAGTEAGITEPKPTFSAGFGAPFLPLHPTKYAEMLGERMRKHNVNVWLINTGWSGGAYGVGKRMKLSYTRAMIHAALDGKLNDVEFTTTAVFGLHIPTSCPNVPTEILLPRNTWADKTAFDKQALHLANLFVTNFEKFADNANEEIMAAAPNTSLNVVEA
jgi:phosphoenolpyruvate carboxykinase (ATP)